MLSEYVRPITRPILELGNNHLENVSSAMSDRLIYRLIKTCPNSKRTIHFGPKLKACWASQHIPIRLLES
jgi:hypothetical protein